MAENLGIINAIALAGMMAAGLVSGDFAPVAEAHITEILPAP